MLQLLTPLALVALAALALPAIVHLWRPPAKTVRVGTLQFFAGPGIKRLNKLRWRERLLLAVRLSLLALLALLLAQPIWRKSPPTRPQKWMIAESGIELRDEAKRRWSELAAAGFRTRELPPGWAEDAWSSLRELDARLPAGSRVAVFTSQRLAALRGERPQMRNVEVEWIPVTAAAGEERTWIESVRLSASAEELHLLIGRSNAVGTDYERKVLPAAADRTGAIEISADSVQGFNARVVSDSAIGSWVPAEKPKTLRIALLHEVERSEDARYVEAGLRAIGDASGMPLIFDKSLASAQWIFWLHDQPPSAEVLQAMREGGANLLSDAENSEDAMASSSWIGDESVRLFRRTFPDGEKAAPVWVDGSGVPLLTVRNEGGGRHWRFYSRFHTDWNELPRTSALAAALRPILLVERASGAEMHDVRRADRTQVLPAEPQPPVTELPLRLVSERESVSLHTFLWLLCAGLFLVERVLSHRRVASTAAVAGAVEPSREEVLV